MAAGPDLVAQLRRELEQRRLERAQSRRRRLVLAGAAAVVLLVVGLAYVLLLHLPPSTSHRAEAPMPAGAEDRVFVLIMGLDSRVNQVERTDTMLVASLNPKTGEAGVLSLPRDTRVQVPGTQGYRKLNAAYAMGGARLAAETVSQLLGVPVDYYVLLDFESFARLVDTLGGVQLVVERPMRYEDQAQGLYIDLPAGDQHLDGDQALEYVRFRADNLGDVALVDPSRGEYGGRVERQLKFVQALAREVLQPETVLQLPRLVAEYRRSVTTDLPTYELTRLARALARVQPEDVRTGLVPGTASMQNGVGYWVPDPLWLRSTVAEVLLGQERPAVQVVNGKGTPGLAGRVSLELKRRGFPVLQVSNAQRFGVGRTRIEAPPGWGEQAQALAQELPVKPELVPLRGDGGSLRLVLGTDFPDGWAINPADLDHGRIPWETAQEVVAPER
ncbi:LCP family protein [Limnochorda pilosa]|uniref:Transcriptional regulator n=1 Tax=Limnochorda pilosa TaxID=1555112 RepID=A0A0K2SN95_LIMPI|nr:LCP family protein [Limnochorda pilosa]BAS28603.1 transcriptional regulator [Limnochorda pilosa]